MWISIVYEHLGCFQLFANVSNATASSLRHVSFNNFAVCLWGRFLEEGLPGESVTMPFCQPLPSFPPCLWHSQQPCMRGHTWLCFPRALQQSVSCGILANSMHEKWCLSAVCEVSIISVTTNDNNLLCAGGSGCRRVKVQGHGGRDVNSGFQNVQQHQGPCWTKFSRYFCVALS